MLFWVFIWWNGRLLTTDWDDPSDAEGTAVFVVAGPSREDVLALAYALDGVADLPGMGFPVQVGFAYVEALIGQFSEEEVVGVIMLDSDNVSEVGRRHFV